MRTPYAWLREYCDPGLTAVELAERLDLTGTELERIEPVGAPSGDGFVVGKVLSAEQHPDADRLKVCQVDVGAGEPSTIVCGAPNVAAGQTVPVALPGAVLPNGMKLGKAKLRGVESHGMICAEDELGLGDLHKGIMVLDDGFAAGTPLADVVPVADEALELEITPNRPDCLSVYGIAREVHAATGAPLAPDPTDADAEPSGSDRIEDHASVEIADPDVCLRFTARVFEDVKIGPSPLWLRQRLIAAGQRPIDNVVDITNYVMLLTGQPMHAFDLDRVRGAKIVVRKAAAGETMTTLDDVERAFDPSMALVCDAEGPSGIAGIMGGQISEVSEGTTRVLMEAATWVGPNVLKTSKALGLRSEASTRFEKQLHPDQALAAQRLAARLMVELAGARLVPGTIDAHPEPAVPRTIELSLDRVAAVLGVRIEAERIVEILGSLGFVAEPGADALSVAVPPWRDADVQRPADLIEEIARIYGLDKLPTTLPARERAVGRLTHAQRLRRRLEDALRDRGMDEIVAWSFTAPATLERLRLAGADVLTLSNPLSEDHSVMRPLLLPGLLDAARRNAAHGAAGVALFESAHVYAPDASSVASGGVLDAPQGSPEGATPASERHHVAGLLTESAPATWRGPAGAADFYAAKGYVEALLAAAGLELSVEPTPDLPYLHPGRAARALVAIGSGAGAELVDVGWIGELHPLVAREWDLDRGAAAFELDADVLAELTDGALATYEDVTSFPAVRQDIAVVAPSDVSAARIKGVVAAAGGELLASTAVFDVYGGAQVGEGKRSLALRLEFRAPDRTLTEDEVAERRNAIEAALTEIGGGLRG